MSLWNDSEHVAAAAFADVILQRAIIFASEVPLPDSAAMRPNSNTLVSKHVEAQLAYFKMHDSKGKAEALETLAKAHATDGVRVKTVQPWHKE